MKPDWKDAPPWAQWLAQDRGGTWIWYERQPRRNDTRGWWIEFGDGEEKVAMLGKENPNWRDTLEQRPDFTGEDAPYMRSIQRLVGSIHCLQDQRRRLIEALRPLALSANPGRPAHMPLVAYRGKFTLHEAHAQAAHNLLRELGEWPEAQNEMDHRHRGEEGCVTRCPDEAQRQRDEVLANLPPAIGYIDLTGRLHPIHPRAQCGECGGRGEIWFTMILSQQCPACHGTGRRHVNGKEFYCAEEVAQRARETTKEGTTP